MKKDKRNTFNHGFTVAEILISLAIVMVVATAMVPIICTNKQKRPENRMVHGIAVCYYDQEGHLNYEYRENKAGGNARAGTVEGDHCVFTVPKAANYLEIIAIGAGGDSTYNDFALEMTPGEHSGEGSLRIDEHYQADIDAASAVDAALPGKIRETIDEWARQRPAEIFARYTDIISPIGRGGTGKCRAKYANGACSAFEPLKEGDAPNRSYYASHTADDATTFTSRCWWYQHGRGGNSGTGLKVANVQFPLSGSSTIEFEQNISNIGVSVTNSVSGSNSIRLTASGNGGDAEWGNGRYNDGANSNQNATCVSEGANDWCHGATPVDANPGNALGTEIPAQRACDDNKQEATAGTITYMGQGGGNAFGEGAINWRYQDPSVNVTFARMGGYGSEISQIFENISGVLHLIPALNNNDDGSTFSRVEREDGTQILRAQSGSDNGGAAAEMTLDQVAINEQIPTEIRNFAVPDNAGHFKYLGKLSNSGYDIPILACIQAGNCPGYAGTGNYLFVNNNERLEFLTVTNRQNGANYVKFFGADAKYRAEENCPNEDEMQSVNGENADWASVCTGRNRTGSPGAIIVIW